MFFVKNSSLSSRHCTEREGEERERAVQPNNNTLQHIQHPTYHERWCMYCRCVVVPLFPSVWGALAAQKKRAATHSLTQSHTAISSFTLHFAQPSFTHTHCMLLYMIALFVGDPASCLPSLLFGDYTPAAAECEGNTQHSALYLHSNRTHNGNRVKRTNQQHSFVYPVCLVHSDSEVPVCSPLQR